MKLIHVLLFFTPTLAFAQDMNAEKSKEPFKGANTIIFKSTIPDDSLYTLVGRKLVSEGFSIDVNNRDFLQMKTGEKDTKGEGLKFKLTISIANREVITRITMVTDGVLGVHDWTYNSHKTTIYYFVQQLVLDLLKEFGEIYYEKK